MMKLEIMLIAACCFFLFSCEEATEGLPAILQNPGEITIENGLWGTVYWWEGNHMPSPDAPDDGPNGTVQRELQFFEATTRNETVESPEQGAPFFSEVLTELIARAESDSNGFFEVELQPGVYSIFVIEGAEYYASSSRGEIMNYVEILPDSLHETEVHIKYAASF